MIETILDWCSSTVAECLEYLVNWFLNALCFDLDYIQELFPILGTSYEVFRAIAVGLVIVISAFALAKYFGGQVESLKETPLSILARAFFAIALIYMGGWIVEYVFNVVKVPWGIFTELDATKTVLDQSTEDYNDVVLAVGGTVITKGISMGLTSLAAGTMLATVGTVLGIGVAAICLIAFAIICLIAKNIITVMIDVAQRYMYLILLVYSAPLAFATAASKDTADILKKWINMFTSQCLLMVLSAWSLKVILSAFSYSGEDDGMGMYLIRVALGVAMCTVCNKLDTYLQRLGLNTVTTGINLADAIANSVKGHGIGSAERGGSKASVLGAVTGIGLSGTGPIGAIPGAISAASQARAKGQSVGDSLRKGFKDYAGHAIPSRQTEWYKSFVKPGLDAAAEQNEKAVKENGGFGNWVKNGGLKQSVVNAAQNAAEKYPDPKGLNIRKNSDGALKLGGIGGNLKFKNSDGSENNTTNDANAFVVGDAAQRAALVANALQGFGASNFMKLNPAVQDVLQNTARDMEADESFSALSQNALEPNTGTDALASIAFNNIVGNSVFPDRDNKDVETGCGGWYDVESDGNGTVSAKCVENGNEMMATIKDANAYDKLSDNEKRSYSDLGNGKYVKKGDAAAAATAAFAKKFDPIFNADNKNYTNVEKDDVGAGTVISAQFTRREQQVQAVALDTGAYNELSKEDKAGFHKNEIKNNDGTSAVWYTRENTKSTSKDYASRIQGLGGVDISSSAQFEKHFGGVLDNHGISRDGEYYNTSSAKFGKGCVKSADFMGANGEQYRAQIMDEKAYNDLSGEEKSKFRETTLNTDIGAGCKVYSRVDPVADAPSYGKPLPSSQTNVMNSDEMPEAYYPSQFDENYGGAFLDCQTKDEGMHARGLENIKRPCSGLYTAEYVDSSGRRMQATVASNDYVSSLPESIKSGFKLCRTGPNGNGAKSFWAREEPLQVAPNYASYADHYKSATLSRAALLNFHSSSEGAKTPWINPSLVKGTNVPWTLSEHEEERNGVTYHVAYIDQAAYEGLRDNDKLKQQFSPMFIDDGNGHRGVVYRAEEALTNEKSRTDYQKAIQKAFSKGNSNGNPRKNRGRSGR